MSGYCRSVEKGADMVTRPDQETRPRRVLSFSVELSCHRGARRPDGECRARIYTISGYRMPHPHAPCSPHIRSIMTHET